MLGLTLIIEQFLCIHLFKKLSFSQINAKREHFHLPGLVVFFMTIGQVSKQTKLGSYEVSFPQKMVIEFKLLVTA